MNLKTRPTRRHITAGLTALALVASTQINASAANAALPEGSQSRRADSRTHNFCVTDFSGYESEARDAMQILDSITIMSDSETSCSTSVDIWWFKANLPGSVRGRWSCDFPGGVDICDSSDIQMDFAQIDIGSNDSLDREKTAVHEIGHSVGLWHDSVSSMVSGPIPSTALQWRRYTSFDQTQIDNQY